MADFQRDRPEERAALIHELVEALTAVTNYLEAANHVLGLERRPGQETLGETIERGLGQVERANEAARRLRELFRREAADDDL